MAELNYSSQALNTLDRFHRAKYIVYVEGDDDRPFWREIFRIAGIEDVYLKVAEGRSEIEKYEKLIVENSVNIVVARDSDYTNLFANQIDHPRIIYTYGYSIENTLYSPRNIAVAISILSRSAEEDVEKVKDWLAEFVSEIRPLLIHDIANELFGKGTQILGNNCTRFLKSGSSVAVSRTKIDTYLETVQEQFTDEELETVTNLLDEYSREHVFLVRGHFLSNAIINFVKKESRLSSMSQDMLFGQMLGQLPAHCRNNEDVLHLQERIKKVLN